MLMLIAGISGAASWDRVLDFVQRRLGGEGGLRIVAYLLVAIASLGGLLVILATILVSNDRVRSGRALIWLGTGFGLIGLALFMLVHLERQELPFASGIGLGAIGVILSIVARFKSKVVSG